MAQQTNLLIGAQNAYKAFMNYFPSVSFRLAYKGTSQCGENWFPTPDALTQLFAIAVVTDAQTQTTKTYQINALNPEWTQFSKPTLLGDGPWVGAAEYNPLEVGYTETESFAQLALYFTEKGYQKVQYTRVGLTLQAYPPFLLSYNYDVDLSPYGFSITQFLSVPHGKPVGQADEVAHCPLPA